MLLQLDFSTATPIYQQIRDQIVRGIAEGELAPADRAGARIGVRRQRHDGEQGLSASQAGGTRARRPEGWHLRVRARWQLGPRFRHHGRAADAPG